MTKQVLKLGGILCAITFIVTLLLGGVNEVTKDIIAENSQKAENEAVAELIKADYYKKISDSVYEGVVGGKNCSGYCVRASAKGYGGDIVMLVGYDTDLKLLGIKILEISETAGLGSKAAMPEFSEALSGKEPLLSVVKNGAGKNEIDAISGATVTTNAVAKAINQSYEELLKTLGR